MYEQCKQGIPNTSYLYDASVNNQVTCKLYIVHAIQIHAPLPSLRLFFRVGQIFLVEFPANRSV